MGKNVDAVGSMREKIQIASHSITRDGIGGAEDVFTNGPFISARVTYKAVGTDELQSSSQRSPEGKVDFTVRFRQVKETDRIVYRGEVYEIEGIIPDEFRHFLIIETKYYGRAAQ